MPLWCVTDILTTLWHVTDVPTTLWRVTEFPQHWGVWQRSPPTLWHVTEIPTTLACDRDPHQHCAVWQWSPQHCGVCQISQPTALQGNNTEKCFKVLFRVPWGELCIWIGHEMAWFYGVSAVKLSVRGEDKGSVFLVGAFCPAFWTDHTIIENSFLVSKSLAKSEFFVWRIIWMTFLMLICFFPAS